jgi:hypothetical protein
MEGGTETVINMAYTTDLGLVLAYLMWFIEISGCYNLDVITIDIVVFKVASSYF